NPRSTGGTVTEIHDYLRLLFARAGTPYCPDHGLALQAHSVAQMVDQLLALPEDTRLMVLAPVVMGRKGEQAELLEELRAQGSSRVRVDGKVHELDAAPRLAKNVKRIVAHPNLSLASGAIRGWDRRNHFYYSMLQSLAKHYHFDIEQPWEMLDERVQRLILEGSGKEKIPFHYPGERGRASVKEHPFEGVVPNLERRYRETDSLAVREELAKLIALQTCPECGGARLRREARYVRLGEQSLHDISRWPLGKTLAWFRTLT